MKISYDFFKQSGIYCIENILNNKKYIGSSKNIYQRLHKHRTFLIRNKHQNIILQNSINKNGIENFKCYLLEECNQEILLEREQYYIDTLKPDYNITIKVIRNNLTETSKSKISETLKRKYKEGLDLQNNKELYLFDLFGNFIKHYNSFRKCQIELGLSEKQVSWGFNGKIKTPYNYIFSKTRKLNFKFKLKLTNIKSNKFYYICNLKKQCLDLDLNYESLSAAFRRNKIYLNEWILTKNINNDSI